MAVLPTSYPFEAVAVKKYKSPHKNDLSFAKGDAIRVTATAPKDEDDNDEEDEEDDIWLIGESLDGTKSGTFPASHVQEAPTAAAASAAQPDTNLDKDLQAASAPAAAAATPAVAAGRTDANDALAATDAPGSGRHEPAQTPSIAVAGDAVASARKDVQPPETITEEAALQDVDKKLDEAAADPKQDVEVPTQASSTGASSAAAAPERKSSTGPPPAAPKPSGLAARIAAFNRPAEGPPPLPRGKPGAWKKPPAAPGPKPVPSAAPADSNANIETDASETQSSKANSGFSAADAQSSIKMSLKERMAALQRGGEGGDASSETKARTAPKPAPGRISEDKRTAAMSTTVPPTEQAPSPMEEKVVPSAPVPAQRTGGSLSSLSKDPTIDSAAEANPVVVQADSSKPEEEITMTEDVAASADREEDAPKTEEEQEAERRAAIAKRMAALGGRRMGGGPALFGAPAPAGPKPERKNTAGSVKTDSETAEDVQPANRGASLDTAAEKEEEATNVGQTLAVPRRAAPPRKKKSPSASSLQGPSEFQGDATKEDTRDNIASTTSNDVREDGDGGIEEGKRSDSDATRLQTAAVVGAGTGSILTDEEHMTAEPIMTGIEDAQEGGISNVDHKPDASVHKVPSLVEPTKQGDDVTKEDDRLGGAPEADEDDDYMKYRVPSSRGTDTFEPGTPVSQTELEDRARQLEAFVHPRANDEDEAEEERVAEGQVSTLAEEDTPQMPQRTAVASPPPPSSAPPRAPSARPPIPKTPVIPSGADDESENNDDVRDAVKRFSSPSPSRAPPVPLTGHRQASINEEDANSGHSALGAGAAALAGGAGLGAATAAIVAPKARAAEAQPLSDDEDEEDKAAIEPSPAKAEGGAEGSIEQRADSAKEEIPVDEEGSERMRRARLAERMARMGAQPIMGAPMPFRKKSVPTVEPVEEQSNTAALAQSERQIQEDESRYEAAESQTDTGVMAEADESDNHFAQVTASPDRAILTSPPPVPTMSPPPPVPRTQMSGSEPMAKRLSSSAESVGSMTREGPLRSRPPVPMTQYTANSGDGDTRGSDAQSPPRAPMSPPPKAPMSPPPRAPPQRPPVPKEELPTQEQESVMLPAEPQLMAGSSTQSQPLAPPTSASLPRSTSLSSLKVVQPSAPSSRDIDLMPSSQWWRHGLPVKLPPTLMRPDALPNVSVQHDGRQHLIRIDLLFEDYSSTIVTVLYEDDDAAEEATRLTQQHNFAPARPSTQQLQYWSQMYGNAIAKQATAILAAKGNAPIFGDGTSRGFMTALVTLSTKEACLPPVGSSFGAILLAQAATTIVDTGADEIRPGDIVALHGADFKGKRGLGSYHATFGTANNPTYACVVEADASSTSKKRKLRCALVGATSGNSSGRPEETSLRLDDVRSGLLRVFRVAPREGWLPMAQV